MSYMALYRKFRPDQFEEVKGQEHIVTTLKNQLTSDRVGHAYLFCGTRGTGKTTVAKLFAKAVNCEHPVNGDPCGECDSCRAIAAGSFVDVVEIDAASNNGVDNIRAIKEQVSYTPVKGKYIVYIIDEVHMLSVGAFNALLKTLEEPPSYVIFILATTESHKIPITILSRCQKYNFRRISIDTIAQRLTDLMKREQIPVEDKAIRYIARAADGSMRDALSLLDQCIAFYLDQELTYERVLDVLGAVDIEMYQNLLKLIMSQDTKQVLEYIEEIIWQGKELAQFVTDFMWHLRNMLLIKSGDVPEDTLNISSDNLAEMTKAAAQIDSETLMRYIRVLSELLGELKHSTSKRVLTEIAFIKLCKPQMEQNYDSILDRLRQMEAKIVELESRPQVAVSAPVTENVSAVSDQEKPAPQKNITEILADLEPATVTDLKKIAANWRTIVKEAPPRAKYLLNYAKLVVGDDGQRLCLLFENSQDGLDGKKTFDRPETMKELEDKVSLLVEKQVKIDCQIMSSGESNNQSYYDFSNINFNVEIEE